MLLQAQTRSEQLLAESTARRDALLQDLEGQHGTLERQVQDLRAFEREYRARLRDYFTAQLHSLDDGTGEQSGRVLVAAGTAPAHADAPNGQGAVDAAEPVALGQPAEVGEPVVSVPGGPHGEPAGGSRDGGAVGVPGGPADR